MPNKGPQTERLNTPRVAKSKKFRLDYGETHLTVQSDVECRSAALEELISHYSLLVDYINRNPLFKASYEPFDAGSDAPMIVRLMAEASRGCGVGPMAAVAGAFAQVVGERMVAEGCGDVIVENGGDIYLKLAEPKRVGIYAGPSALSMRYALMVRPEDTPCGLCTSSASVGPSISLGKADAATVMAGSAQLADAAASAIGNVVKDSKDMEEGLRVARKLAGVRGAIIIKDDVLGAWGRLPEIVE
jgi:uncharacterized protein